MKNVASNPWVGYNVLSIRRTIISEREKRYGEKTTKLHSIYLNFRYGATFANNVCQILHNKI